MSELAAECQQYREQGKWNNLVKALEKLADEYQHHPEERKTTLFELADVYRSQLNLHVMVINTLRKINTIDANDVRALDELASQYEELERWHAVTLGREGRVIELKQEVNALLAAAGQSPKYSDADWEDEGLRSTGET